jgi:hypothetical protein
MLLRSLLFPTRGLSATISLLLVPLVTAHAIAQADSGRVYSIDDVDRVPERLFCPGARFSRSLTGLYEEAQVTASFIVGANGRAEPGSVKAFSPTDQGFEQPTSDMIYECLFEPGIRGSKPVRVKMVLPLRWSFAGKQFPMVNLDSVDINRIFTLADTVGGRRVVTKAPKLVNCPRYDPQERPNRSRINDRYEREQRFERAPLNIDALLEIVVGTDGQVRSKETRVLKTNDHRADKAIMQWVQSCFFEPGKVGDADVTVRMEFTVKYEFVRGL